ncbi:MAG: hypothetical protein D6686_08680 [Alphaproteobacteria bacterium]|nr:MAG: hypothetical protein D6686_08680 [Alphaproteobacteria bacterium]
MRGWTVTAIEVDVPQTLSVSEDPSVRYPATDIVWWEDPPGDRRAQVARVMEAAAREAVADLDGPEPVTMRLRVNRFHALTPVALASGRRGWHDVNFDVAIVARDGRVLAEERGVNADLRALQGAQAEAARQGGETQAARIRRRVAAVLRGWLGLA